MSHWYYLKHPAVRSRSMLAAAHLEDCSHILEIGGFGTPINEIVKDKQVTVIDPLIESCVGNNHVHIRGSFLDISPPPGDYGLIALGMHFEPEDKSSWEHFAKFVKLSKRTVVEFASTFSPSRDIFNHLVDNLSFTEKLCIKMDFTENNMTGYDHGYPLFLERELWVLTSSKE